MKSLKSSFLSTILFIFLLLESSGLFSQSGEKESWPQFRGPNCAGIADERVRPPVEFGETKNLRWKIDLPVGSSSPVIRENKIYLTAFIPDKKELQVICINRDNGEKLWYDSIFPAKFERNHPVSNPAQASVAVDGDGIYVYFASYGVRCYDHQGTLKWDLRIPTPGANYGHPNSPIVADGKVILNLDYGADSVRRLMTLNKFTGEIIWKSFIQKNSPLVNFGFPGFSTPVLYQDQVILHRCGGIASYSLKDGAPVWWYSILTNGVSTPVIKNNIVYVGAWMELSESERRGGYLKYDSFEKAIIDYDQNRDSLLSLAEIPENLMVFTRPGIEDIENSQWSVRKMFNGIDTDKNGLINEKEWMDRYKFFSDYVQDLGLFAIPATLKGELSAKDVLWMQMEKNPEVPSPLALDDCIYMVKDGGWVTCMDAKTGKVYYQEKLGSPGAYLASPVAANGYIYLSSHNGIIKVIKAEKKPELVSETKLEGKILATPAIAGNNLYVRTSEHLYSFQK